METRELFERLVTEEPPLALNASAVSARGHQAARRRQGGAAALGTAVLVVALIATTQLIAPDQRHRGTLAPAGPKAVTSLPFASAEQITASTARVYALLLGVAGDRLTLGLPHPSGQPTAVPYWETEVQFTVGGASVGLAVTAANPAGSRTRYGSSVAVATTCPQQPAQFSGRTPSCVAVATLAGGARLFTVRDTARIDARGDTAADGSSPRLMGFSALLVAPDGSTLNVSEMAELGPHDGLDVPLPPGALDGSALATLAEQAALTWQDTAATRPEPPAPVLSQVATPPGRVGSTPSAVGAETSADATQASLTAEAMPSLSTAITTLAFSGAAQITASNAAVYKLLKTAAAGEGKVVKGWPTWDSEPVSAKTTSLGTQVEYRTAAGVGMLRAVTGDRADSGTRYAGLLSRDLCAELAARSTDNGSFVNCAHQPLAGGGNLWTYARKESTPGQMTNRASSSTLGPAIYERDAIVVATDGSALDLIFQELGTEGGGEVPLPLSSAISPSGTALGDQALAAAESWAANSGG